MREHPRVLVIGLDGATFRVLRPMVEAQKLPALGKLMRRGCWGTLESIVPPITPPAWTSFFTGCNPGKHGIYNFTMNQPSEYENLRLVNTQDIRCSTLWDIVSAAGKQVGVMNVPMSYPVWPVNGFMISCMYTPRSIGVATHPPELAAELGPYQTSERSRIKVPPGHPKYKAQALAYLEEIERVTDLHAQTALRLLQSKPWDLFAQVFMTLDRVQHFFWRYLEPGKTPATNQAQPHHDPEIAARLEAILQGLDNSIGRLVEAAGPQTTTFVVSDHGFGPDMTRTVNLHRLFQSRGWLRRESFWFVKRLYRKTLSRLSGTERRFSFDKKVGVICWRKTKAWAELLGPTCAGIRINRVGTYPEGMVTENEYPRLRSEIREALLGLRDADGTPIVREAKPREEVFSGAQVSLAPDLIVFLHDQYYLTKSAAKDLAAGTVASPLVDAVRDGNHEPAGIYIAAGPPIATAGEQRVFSIVSVAPTILALLNVPVPANMDGEVMAELLRPGFVAAHPSRRTEAVAPSATESRGGFQYSVQDEEEIRARLANLGYLE